MSSGEQRSDEDVHVFYMRQALDEARKCIHVPTAFCVGCTIVVPADAAQKNQSAEMSITATDGPTLSSLRNVRGIVLATGYSRELEGNTHAEANALYKARQIASLATDPSTTSSIGGGGGGGAADVGIDIEPAPLPSAERSISNLLSQASIYTTLEPCSIRTSGLAPCAGAILSAGIKKCYIGAPEPLDFVTCEGAKILRDAGVEVIWVKGLEEECLSVARGEF